MKILELVKKSIAEDIPTSDITANLLIPKNTHSKAHIIAKSSGIFFGTPIINAFQNLYPSITFNTSIKDGDMIHQKTPCILLEGPLNTIIEIERTLLNFLQRLCGIATITHQFVQALNNPSIDILDTRKTTPLLRQLEKQAVIAGGGVNHRTSLSDMILVKENHLLHYIQTHSMSSFNNKLTTHKKEHPHILIEVEISSLHILNELKFSPIDIIMFDNMPLDTLQKCLNILNQSKTSILKEVSGNITLESIKQYQHIAIDRISIGSLTHSVKAFDLSLLVL